MTTPSMDDLCRIYVKIRTKKQEVTKDYDASIAVLDEKLNTLAGAMKDILVATGGTSIKTEHGTVYSTIKTKYYPMDWSMFGEWIIKNNALDLLEKRVAQRNTAQWLDEHPNNPPPGLQAESEQTVVVRKS
jgi:hypothetical protein